MSTSMILRGMNNNQNNSTSVSIDKAMSLLDRINSLSDSM